MILKVLGITETLANGQKQGVLDYIEDVARVRSRGMARMELENIEIPIEYTFDPTDVPDEELLYVKVTFRDDSNEWMLLRRGWAFLLNDDGDTIDRL